MNESIVLTSSKDLNGICILDLHTATPICSNLKNNIADSGSMCTVGGSSSYSGNSSSTSDYLCIAQAKKPSISIWSWGKAQPIMQCHVQEVMSCLESDRYGAYIIGGSKKGMIYIWEVATGALLTSWQAHFKEVTRVRCSPNSDFFGSASTDGMARVWSLSAIIDTAALNQFRQSHTPYKSWSPHTLAVKDMCFSGGYSTMRVFTCSLDRSLVLYDVHRGVQVMRIGLSQGLECLICNPTEDFCFVGSSSGHIFAVDLSIAASNVCQVRMHQNQTERTRNTKTGIVATMNEKPGSTAASATDTSNNKLLATATSTTNPSTSTSTSSTTNTAVAMTLEGHTRTVTALCVSADNCTLVSVSEDGSLRLWDIWTGQCLKEVKPLHKAAITNAKIISRPEQLQLAVSGASKPTLAPFGHLQKFAHDSSSKTSATSVTTATVNSNNSQTRSSSVMLSPQILPCRADIAIKAKRNKTEKLEEKNDQGRSKSRKLISEENEEGYVSLSVAV